MTWSKERHWGRCGHSCPCCRAWNEEDGGIGSFPQCFRDKTNEDIEKEERKRKRNGEEPGRRENHCMVVKRIRGETHVYCDEEARKTVEENYSEQKEIELTREVKERMKDRVKELAIRTVKRDNG